MSKITPGKKTVSEPRTASNAAVATRFGRSYQAENYYEALSDAVLNTVSSMLQAGDFQKAMSGHGIGPTT